MISKSFPHKADVVVVGAGPAGSILAYQLAKAGVDVVLLDKARFPRGKTCGGGINVRTQKQIPFDFSPIIEGTITGISFTCKFEDPFIRRYTAPLMFTVRREHFDEFLARRAEEAGARFFDQTPFLSVDQKGGYGSGNRGGGMLGGVRCRGGRCAKPGCQENAPLFRPGLHPGHSQ
ncbi:MAG TPA: FAD-dependent oxidoreductase [Thermodesulfobacteriota bacterium]|nr:FAD-dependent oxidoreductase [Thermodesulfobacteriota bacterium]